MENADEYLPVRIEVEDVMGRHFPLLRGSGITAIVEDILTALQGNGALVDLDACRCGDPAIFGTDQCPRHTPQEE